MWKCTNLSDRLKPFQWKSVSKKTLRFIRGHSLTTEFYVGLNFRHLQFYLNIHSGVWSDMSRGVLQFRTWCKFIFQKRFMNSNCVCEYEMKMRELNRHKVKGATWFIVLSWWRLWFNFSFVLGFVSACSSYGSETAKVFPKC